MLVFNIYVFVFEDGFVVVFVAGAFVGEDFFGVGVEVATEESERTVETGKLTLSFRVVTLEEV